MSRPVRLRSDGPVVTHRFLVRYQMQGQRPILSEHHRLALAVQEYESLARYPNIASAELVSVTRSVWPKVAGVPGSVPPATPEPQHVRSGP